MVQRYREVRLWTQEKLTLLSEYLNAYVIATKRAREYGNISYVDLFSGPGQDRLKETGQIFNGSPLIAMNLSPGFTSLLFVDSDPENIGSLQTWISRLGLQKEADAIAGDCNQKIEEVIQLLPKDGPCFFFLDPPSPVLDWRTIVHIADVRVGYRRLRPEQFILFPYNMGLVRLMPFSAPPENIWGPTTEEQISRVMPDPLKWRLVYEDWRKGKYEAQQKRRRFLYLYWMGLKGLGYKHVLGPRLIKTPDGLPLYDLFFTSDNDAGRNIMRDIFNKPRDMFSQQLRLIQEDPFEFQEGEQWYLDFKG